MASVLPARGRPAGLPKRAWGWLGCALLQPARPVPGPQASWAGGKALTASTICLAWGQHGHCQASALEGISSMMELPAPPCVSSCSAALCPCSCFGSTRFLQRQSCVLAPLASAAVLRCVVKGQWSCHGAGLSIHHVTSPAGSQILLRTCPHSYLLPSPASLPLTVSCLSLCPFLNSCLHCALKMKSAV